MTGFTIPYHYKFLDHNILCGLSRLTCGITFYYKSEYPKQVSLMILYKLTIDSNATKQEKGLWMFNRKWFLV